MARQLEGGAVVWVLVWGIILSAVGFGAAGQEDSPKVAKFGVVTLVVAAELLHTFYFFWPHPTWWRFALFFFVLSPIAGLIAVSWAQGDWGKTKR